MNKATQRIQEGQHTKTINGKANRHPILSGEYIVIGRKNNEPVFQGCYDACDSSVSGLVSDKWLNQYPELSHFYVSVIFQCE